MAKVSLIKCEDYIFENVLGAVRRAVDLIGGLGAFIRHGSNVLLKPNLLSARSPEEGVDTHPAVVKAIIRLVKEAGGKVSIGDSPGGYGKNIDEVYEKSGMKAIAGEEGIELVRFTSSKDVEGFPVSRHVLDADYIISIPKLKTHHITAITAAVKNVFGAVTGLSKAECHSRAPKEDDFARIISKVYSLVRPGMTILDAIVAMEGNGPAAGELRKTNFIMASTDGVALDSVVAKVIDLNPLEIATTKEAYKSGLGEADLSKIEIAGDDLDSFIMYDFKLPLTTRTSILKLVPKLIINPIASMIRFRPFIEMDACKRCNLCKLSCPADAINIEDEKCRIDYRKCIRCLCCREVCPYGAIIIKGNLLTRLIWGG